MAEQFKYNPTEGLTPMQKVGLILSQGAMAFGEGLTGRPFLSNYQQQEQNRMKLAYDEWKQRQQLQAYTNASTESGTVPTVRVPDPTSPIGFRTEIDPNYKGRMEAEQQAQTAVAKEGELAIKKAERLKTVGETVKKQWLNTSPYKGAITRTGLVPMLGAWDIVKKGIGATSAQRADQVYSDFIQGIRAQLARGMGDVGNLSEYEQRAVVRLLPNLQDSYESGVLKLGQLAQLVDDIKSTRKKQGIASFTVNGKTYEIPEDKISDFKKDMGLK